MATVGEILKNERIGRNITLAEVEKATKIRQAFLDSLEKGHYQSLPSNIYARGFIRNYARFLGLPEERLLARLRRELNERGSSLLPKGLDEDIPFRRVRVTGVILLVVALVSGIFLYLMLQYRGFLGSPTLIIEFPSQNEIVKDSQITVSGKTEPDATVKVNDELAVVDKEGRFQKNLNLFKGTFTIVIISTNRFDRQTQVSRTITIK